MDSAVQQTLHDWFVALPGGTRGSHANSMSSNSTGQSHDNTTTKKKSRRKKNKANKTTSNKTSHNKSSHNTSHVPARFYYDQHKSTSMQLSQFFPSSNCDQPTLHNFAVTNRDRFSNVFGDDLILKEDGICRIVTQNVGCLGISMFGNNKMRTIKE